MMSVDFNNIAISNINGIDYGSIISEISQSETISLLTNADVSEKSRAL